MFAAIERISKKVAIPSKEFVPLPRNHCHIRLLGRYMPPLKRGLGNLGSTDYKHFAPLALGTEN